MLKAIIFIVIFPNLTFKLFNSIFLLLEFIGEMNAHFLKMKHQFA